jgi:hypothetical protein
VSAFLTPDTAPLTFGEVLAALLVQVEPVGRLGEAQVGVDTRDDDAGVDGQELDAHQRDAHVDIDDESLVEDRLDDVREPARRGPLEVSAASS